MNLLVCCVSRARAVAVGRASAPASHPKSMYLAVFVGIGRGPSLPLPIVIPHVLALTFVSGYAAAFAPPHGPFHFCCQASASAPVSALVRDHQVMPFPLRSAYCNDPALAAFLGAA